MKGLAIHHLQAAYGEAMAHNVDVVVVGAGLSGLTTAYRLVRQGIDRVVVLEAKDRVGGRTLTTTVDGTVLDAGATIVAPAQKTSWRWPLISASARSGLIAAATSIFCGPNGARWPGCRAGPPHRRSAECS